MNDGRPDRKIWEVNIQTSRKRGRPKRILGKLLNTKAALGMK